MATRRHAPASMGVSPGVFGTLVERVPVGPRQGEMSFDRPDWPSSPRRRASSAGVAALRHPLWLVAAAWFFCGCSRLAGPPDLPSLKQQVAAYMEGDGYRRDLCTALTPVLRDLAALPSGRTARLAMVLDIDDTALSTYEYQKGMGFGHYTPAWHDWQRQQRATAITPVLEAFRAAQAKGVAVFFVTGRRESFRADTEANLRLAGYDGWAALMMKPDSYKESSVAPFKTACREQIEGQGYRIGFNLGDQESDLQGGHADRAVKLPNPIYRAP